MRVNLLHSGHCLIRQNNNSRSALEKGCALITLRGSITLLRLYRLFFKSKCILKKICYKINEILQQVLRIFEGEQHEPRGHESFQSSSASADI